MRKIIQFIIILIFISCTQSKKKNESTSIILDKKIVAKETIVKKKEVLKNSPLESKIIIPFTQNKNTKLGVINDSDGFTNLRTKPNSNSEIIKEILKNEYFFYNENEEGNWCKVKDLMENVGFLHSSRVNEKIDTSLYNVSIISQTNYKPKDTIIDLDLMNLNNFDFYEFNGFNYEQITLNNEEENSVSYSDSETIVKISKTKFLSENHKIEYHEEYENAVAKIDNIEVWGTDGVIPEFAISEIKISRNNTDFVLPKSQIRNLFQPNLNNAEVFKTKDGRLMIWMMNSDGAGAYSVIFFIRDNELIKRVVYVPF